MYVFFWLFRESWLAIQPTAPVLKAGHPVSCSSLCICVLYVLCVLFGLLRLRFWVSFFSFYCFWASMLYTFLHVHSEAALPLLILPKRECIYSECVLLSQLLQIITHVTGYL